MPRKAPTINLQEMESRGLDELGRPYWRIRGPDATGKRATIAADRWTRQEAEEQLKIARARATLGLEGPNASKRNWTVSEVVAKAVEELCERLGAEHLFVDHETRRLAHIADHLGSIGADRITVAHLEKYAAARRRDPCRTREPVARRSIQDEIAAWQRAVRTLRDMHQIDFDPAPMPALKAIPDDARPPRRLTEEEVAALLREAAEEGGAPLWSLLTVLAWSGRRPVAVFSATHGDCHRVVDGGLPRPARLMFWARDKGGHGRGWGPLTEPAFHAVLAVASPNAPADELLWRTARHNVWTPNRMVRVFHRLAARADVGAVQLYDLRRFAITQILAAPEIRGQIKVAQQFTGHTTTQSLLRYVFAPQEAAETAAPTIGWTAPQLRAVKEED